MSRGDRAWLRGRLLAAATHVYVARRALSREWVSRWTTDLQSATAEINAILESL